MIKNINKFLKTMKHMKQNMQKHEKLKTWKVVKLETQKIGKHKNKAQHEKLETLKQ